MGEPEMEGDEESAMRGFHYMKALIARYGTEQTAQLTTLAARLVNAGTFPNRRAAIEGIEEQMGFTITTPVSSEVASHTTRRAERGRP